MGILQEQFDKFFDAGFIDTDGKPLKNAVQTLRFANTLTSRKPTIRFSSIAKLFSESDLRARRFLVGEMYMFFYPSPQTEDLEYWDRIPLILMTRIEKEWFEGINFHHLSPVHRTLVYSYMHRYIRMRTTNHPRILLQNNLPESKSTKLIGNATKRYRFDHVARRIIRIPITHWIPMIYLNAEMFAGSSKRRVWSKTGKTQ